MYTVKQAAEKLDMNPHTVRFYTDNNLIPDLKRGENNVRLFDEDAMGWLTGVKNLRDCGMSLKAIKKYVDLCLIGQEAIPERKEVIREQQENVNKELEKLQRCADYLSNKMDFYERLERGEEAYDKTNPLEWSKKENSGQDF